MSVNVSQNAEQFCPKNNLDYHKQLLPFHLVSYYLVITYSLAYLSYLRDFATKQ